MYNLDIEKEYSQYSKILGIDEAGRGCCAGPLVVAGVILPGGFKSDLINDSKKLSESKREQAYQQIIANAIAYSIKFASAQDVDKFNPKKATHVLMQQIVDELHQADLIITDFEKVPNTAKPQINLIKGDSQSLSVAAASILAKVSRDRYMLELSKKFPQYSFQKHKGYATKLHNDEIANHGVCNEHRMSYKNVVNQQNIFLNSQKLNNI
ncbi:ribonuclease HII [Mycoplasma simbae]|uniref:ribonuclease HII n=1 Tax=Mycoplasma simbae TaxID=36744 RepID=UPI000495325A|nr:ribonuclease HII [Mycoplasma simbae]